ELVHLPESPGHGRNPVKRLVEIHEGINSHAELVMSPGVVLIIPAPCVLTFRVVPGGICNPYLESSGESLGEYPLSPFPVQVPEELPLDPVPRRRVYEIKTVEYVYVVLRHDQMKIPERG